jgi:hypothetical protein
MASAPTRAPWLRRFTVGSVLLAATAAGGWVALHRIPDLAPAVADLARDLIGDDAVARAEDLAYGVEDSIVRATRGAEAPRAHWEVKPDVPVREVVVAQANVAQFRPENIGPMHPEHAAPGDGSWITAGSGDNLAYKTLLHPDPERSYSELFVVAIDISRVELHAAPGTQEPENVAEGAELLARSGRVPDDQMDVLFAAFNGGFKTRHGGFGMRTNGVTLVPAKRDSCTIAGYSDGTLRIGTWHKLPDHDSIDWYRQTPGCMVEGGVKHRGLESSKSWGATIDGDTVIRRSALGLSADGSTLFMAISNATHAEALALGMQHVGAAHVAQLDVNHSYPRFLFYQDRGKSMVPLADGFVVKPGQYVSDVSKRDFFYITHKTGDSLAQGNTSAAVRGG